MPSQHILFPPVLGHETLVDFLSEVRHAEVEVILVKPLPQLEMELMHLAVLPPVGLHQALPALVRQALQVSQVLREKNGAAKNTGPSNVGVPSFATRCS